MAKKQRRMPNDPEMQALGWVWIGLEAAEDALAVLRHLDRRAELPGRVGVADAIRQALA
jgi:hypothetical protein